MFHNVLQCSAMSHEFPSYSVSFHHILQDSSGMFWNVPGDSASFFCNPSTSIPSLLVLKVSFLSLCPLMNPGLSIMERTGTELLHIVLTPSCV